MLEIGRRNERTEKNCYSILMQNIFFFIKDHMFSISLFICLAFERYQNAHYTKSYGFFSFRALLGVIVYTKKNYTFENNKTETVCGTYVWMYMYLFYFYYAQKVEVNLIINVNSILIDLIEIQFRYLHVNT